MRGVKNNDVEHEALTATRNDNVGTQTTSQQTNDIRKTYSSRCFSKIYKNQISILATIILLIIISLTGVVLYMVFYDVKKDESPNKNYTGVQNHNTRQEKYLLRAMPGLTKNNQISLDKLEGKILARPNFKIKDNLIGSFKL